MGKRILVITGGDPGPDGDEVVSGAPFDLVIAADSGLDRAESLGIRPDVVIGDLDSASPDAVQRASDQGAEVDAHPAEKEHTDLELALQRAVAEDASEIGLIGGSGGRPDHWLANLGLLAETAHSGVSVVGDMGGWSITVVVPDHPYTAERGAGELMSLLPIAGSARGVTTEGLLYPLRGEELSSGSSRGVSNVCRGGLVQITIEEGTLLAMRPQGQPSIIERTGRTV